MSSRSDEYSVYVGDIHGSRLSPMKNALSELGVEPMRLLSTMDLDQVLSMNELRDYEASFDARGCDALVVPGNHEDALISGIQIDSTTYREKRQETTIEELAQSLNRSEHRSLRTYVETKLQIEGGLQFSLGGSARPAAVVIHGAFRGKEEKYLYEFPAAIQTRVRNRGDMWLRLETGAQLRANFAAMRERGIQTMFRGHDHYVAMRSCDASGNVYGHDLVINELGPDEPGSRDHGARRGDEADVIESTEAAEVTRLGEHEGFHWLPLHLERAYVVNFGPYFAGHFGLVRAGTSAGAPPAVAFCHVETTQYNAADRDKMLGDSSLSARARAGENFYDLFSSR